MIDALATRLRPHYARFLAGGGVWMTGHSHQAWPDVSREAQLRAWDDAARLRDRKWSHIFDEVLPTFQRHVAKRIGSTRPGDLAIAPSTHALFVRLLSCLPARPAVVTTQDEFHSVRRQLMRLEEEGATVAWAEGGEALEDNLVAAIEDVVPDLVIVSQVLFTSARIVDVARVAEAARGAPVLIDAYHAFNAIEMAADAWPGEVFVVGGGYKYAESGEGACWMLLPANAERYRPRDTGWFAAFEALESEPDGRVGYATGGARFAGSTFDPTALYRANAAFELMDALGLDPAALRAQSKLQTTYLLEAIEAAGLAGLTLASPREAERRGAFLAFAHPRAAELVAALEAQQIYADRRSELLRLGPAPYTTTEELDRTVEALAARL